MRPLVIGHRGFPALHPDNSLAGIEAALAAGADGVEVDVRPCAEGDWVCHHDAHCEGVPVAGWTLARLAHRGVPTLDDVLAAVPPDRFLFVEVKPVPPVVLEEGLEALAALLGPRAATTRVLSSSLAVLGRLGDVMPAVGLSWVVDRMPPAPLPPGLELSPFHRLVERLLPRAVPLHPWTANRPGRIAELARLRVASITTNRPDVALEVLGA